MNDLSHLVFVLFVVDQVLDAAGVLVERVGSEAAAVIIAHQQKSKLLKNVKKKTFYLIVTS